MVSFIKMSKTYFDSYLSDAIDKIGKEYALTGYFTKEESLQMSEVAFSNYLPEGIDTKDNYIFNIIKGDNEIIGMIWYGKIKDDEVFIYDFIIYDKFQHQGYGNQAMAYLEKNVKALGINKISLHVFGHNKAAFTLYEKLGYNAFSINMFKSI